MILTGFAVFAGLSLNLILQFALGARQTAGGKAVPYSQFAILFVSVFFLWIFYTYVFSFISWDILGLFLFFPVCALVCKGLEYLEIRFFPQYKPERLFSSLTAYEGLVPASLFLCVLLAVTIVDALFLSLFFAIGCLMSVFILKEINRRSSFEAIPENLRGMPLAFISMGLLSMVFTSVAWIFFSTIYN